jgi:hypothetical protein
MSEIITNRIEGVAQVDRTLVPTEFGNTFSLQEGIAKHFTNILGTSSPASQRSGHNVSSTVDGGVGGYGSNFTIAFATQGYTISWGVTNEVAVQHTPSFVWSVSTGSYQVDHYDKTNSANRVDKSTFCGSIHGVLA